MEINALENEDRVFIKTIFNEMRTQINNFSKDRDFILSNAQLFTFLTYSPLAIAIASDGVVDSVEIVAIEKITKTIDVNSMVDLNLMEFMAVATEPDNCIVNEEFNIRVGSEILFLCRNMKTYEESFLKAVKALLVFDLTPKKDGSMTSTFSKMMDSIIENNLSKEKDAQLEKMKKLKIELGI